MPTGSAGAPEEATPAPFAPPLAEVPLPAADVAALLRHNARGATATAPLSVSATGSGRMRSCSSRRSASPPSTEPGWTRHVRRTSACCSTTPPTTSSPSAAPGSGGWRRAGLNYTWFGEHLARDMSHTDLQLVITEPRHQAQLADAPPVSPICPVACSSPTASPTATTRRRGGIRSGRALDAACPDAQRRGTAPDRAEARRRRCCGRCCSPPGPPPRRRRCAARSAACSPPATGCPRCSSSGRTTSATRRCPCSTPTR